MARFYRTLAPRGAGAVANRRKVDEGSSKRRGVDPTTCDPDYTPEQLEFMLAMQRYREENNRPFPTWSEALGVLKGLGYRK